MFAGLNNLNGLINARLAMAPRDAQAPVCAHGQVTSAGSDPQLDCRRYPKCPLLATASEAQHEQMRPSLHAPTALLPGFPRQSPSFFHTCSVYMAPNRAVED